MTRMELDFGESGLFPALAFVLTLPSGNYFGHVINGELRNGRGCLPHWKAFFIGSAALTLLQRWTKKPTWLKFPDIALLVLFSVALNSFLWGEVAGVIASLLAVFGLDFFVVPPSLSLAVSDSASLPTFLFFVAVSVSVSFLTALLRRWERWVRFGHLILGKR